MKQPKTHNEDIKKTLKAASGLLEESLKIVWNPKRIPYSISVPVGSKMKEKMKKKEEKTQKKTQKETEKKEKK